MTETDKQEIDVMKIKYYQEIIYNENKQEIMFERKQILPKLTRRILT
jgi:hypothetical protein